MLLLLLLYCHYCDFLLNNSLKMAETCGRFTTCLYVIVSNCSDVVCMDNVKYVHTKTETC